MGKKKKNLKMLLGDNPFGELEIIDIPSIKLKDKRKKKTGKKQGKTSGKRLEPRSSIQNIENIISEAEKKINEAIETLEERGIGDKKSLVDFASRIQSKMAAVQVEAGEEKKALQTLFKLIRPSFYIRKIAPLLLMGRGIETDEFGRDEKLESSFKPVMKCLFEKYFRIQVEGFENIPHAGGCIIVANHAPVLSLDGFMIKHAISTRIRTDVRLLLENELFYMPYLGILGQRLGAVRANRENASELLSRGMAIITFPEGIQGISRTFHERYVLKRFGRGGYVRLAIMHSVPVIPAALVGPQNSFPILWKTETGAKLFSIPFIPITPTFPLLGPLGLIPLPFKWKIKFGPPVNFNAEDSRSLDQSAINRLNNSIRDTIQQMINDLRQS